MALAVHSTYVPKLFGAYSARGARPRGPAHLPYVVVIPACSWSFSEKHALKKACENTHTYSAGAGWAGIRLLQGRPGDSSADARTAVPARGRGRAARGSSRFSPLGPRACSLAGPLSRRRARPTADATRHQTI